MWVGHYCKKNPDRVVQDPSASHWGPASSCQGSFRSNDLLIQFYTLLVTRAHNQSYVQPKISSITSQTSSLWLCCSPLEGLILLHNSEIFAFYFRPSQGVYECSGQIKSKQLFLHFYKWDLGCNQQFHGYVSLWVWARKSPAERVGPLRG